MADNNVTVAGFAPEEAEKLRVLMACYECAIMEVETKFNVLNTQYNVDQSYNPIDTIKTRLKSSASILEKLQRRGLPLTADTVEHKLYDIAGVRVICPFEEDIFDLASLFLDQDDVTLVERKDYIAKPKGNGYRSLHLIVSTPVFTPDGKKDMHVEVQFRTIAMEFWANLEHRLRYKKGLDPELLTDLANELRLCADDSAELDRKMGSIRRKIDATRALLEQPDSVWS